MFKHAVKFPVSILLLAAAIVSGQPSMAQAPAAATAGLDAALNNLEQLKQTVARRTTSTKDLESLIRSLINENDSLFVMLSKRSRDLAELRAKFSNTPYSKEYDALMNDLAPLRVPQHPHQSAELLKLLEEQPSAPTAIPDPGYATEALIRDVIRQKNAAMTPERQQAITAAIDTKRQLLEDKTDILVKRQEELAALRDDLQRSNATLKASNTQYQNLNDLLAKENARMMDQAAGLKHQAAEQDEKFNKLKADYTASVREIERLNQQITAANKAIEPFTASLAAQNQSLAALNRSIEEKNAEIARFKDLLNQKEAVIRQQAADLDFTDESLDRTASKLNSIDALLRDNDTSLADLQARVSSIRAQIEQPRPPAFNPAEEELRNAREVIAVLRKDNDALKKSNDERALFFNELNRRLNEMSASSADTSATIRQQQTVLAALTARAEKSDAIATEASRELELKNRELRETQRRLKELEQQITRHELNALGAQEAIASLEDTNESIRESAAKTTAQARDLDIQEKDYQIATLQSELAKKNSILKQSIQLQERLSVMEARQDAIKGVIQKRELEYTGALQRLKDQEAEISRLKAELGQRKN